MSPVIGDDYGDGKGRGRVLGLFGGARELRSEAARMKEKWLEDNKKRPASAPSDEPAPKHRAAVLVSAPRALCRGWGLSSAPLGAGAPSTAPANCTRQSCCACPHQTSEQERAAARRHATTTMHANHAPRAHTARWKAPTELRLMEQLRALEAYKITTRAPNTHVCACLVTYGAARATYGALRCRTVLYGVARCFRVPYIALRCRTNYLRCRTDYLR